MQSLRAVKSLRTDFAIFLFSTKSRERLLGRREFTAAIR